MRINKCICGLYALYDSQNKYSSSRDCRPDDTMYTVRSEYHFIKYAIYFNFQFSIIKNM